jgi:uncharacterized protein (TIGR02246 family)
MNSASLLTFASLLLAPCWAAAQQTGPASETDAQQAAGAVGKAWDQAYNAGNAAAIVDLFAPGGVYLTPGGTMLKDRGEIQTALAARQKTGWTKETIKVLESHPAGDHVWAVVEYTIQGTGRRAGKQIGGYAAELLSRSDSGWKLDLVAAKLAPVRNLVQDVTGMAAATMMCPGPC